MDCPINGRPVSDPRESNPSIELEKAHQEESVASSVILGDQQEAVGFFGRGPFVVIAIDPFMQFIVLN